MNKTNLEKVVTFTLNPQSVKLANEEMAKLADEGFQLSDSQTITENGTTFCVYRFTQIRHSPEYLEHLKKVYGITTQED